MTPVQLRALAIAVALAAAPAAWAATTGEPAPPCSAATLDGGRALSIADYRGKVVYLDFWASWCAPCRDSFPFMNELQRDLASKGLQIVAVSVDKTVEEARRFLDRIPAQFTVVVDVAASCPAAYRLQGMPSSYVIDRSGVVRAVHVGFRNGDREEIRRQLVEMLARGS
jgi:thiol-disulfide isomerase/thioredoxin